MLPLLPALILLLLHGPSNVERLRPGAAGHEALAKAIRSAQVQLRARRGSGDCIELRECLLIAQALESEVPKSSAPVQPSMPRSATRVVDTGRTLPSEGYRQVVRDRDGPVLA